MSPLAIVAITVVLSLFMILLLSAAAGIIYNQLQSRKQISTLTTVIHDHQSALQLLGKDIGATLQSHRVAFDAQIAKINGEELSIAGKAITASAQKIVAASVAIADLCRALVNEQSADPNGIRRAAESGLGPEDFAPNPTNERYTGISRTAAGDNEDFDERESFNNPDTP